MKQDTLKLLTEINRLREVMNLSPRKIILEHRLLTAMSELIGDYFSAAKSSIKDLPNIVKVGTIEMPTSVYDDLLEVIADPSLWSRLEIKSQRLLFRVLAQSPEIVDGAYRDMMTAFLRSTPEATERSFFRAAANQYNEGESINEIITDMNLGIQDEFQNILLGKKIATKIKETNTNSFVEEIKTPPISTRNQDVIRTTSREFRGIPELQTRPHLLRLASNITLFDTVRSTIRSTLLRRKNSLLTLEESLNETLDDMVATLGRLGRDTGRADSSEIITQIRDLKLQMDSIINRFDLNGDNLYKELEEGLKESLSGRIPEEEITSLLKTIKEVTVGPENFLRGGNTWILNFLGDTATANTVKDIFNLIKNIGRTISLRKGAAEEAITAFLNLVQRTLFTIITGHPRTAKEFMSYFKKDKSTGIAMLAFHMWTAYHVALPMQLGFLDTLKNYNLLFKTSTAEKGKKKPGFFTDWYDNTVEEVKKQWGFGEKQSAGDHIVDFFINLPKLGHIFVFDILDYLNRPYEGTPLVDDKKITDKIKKKTGDAFKEIEKLDSSVREAPEKIEEFTDSVLNSKSAEEAKRVGDSLFLVTKQKTLGGEIGFKQEFGSKVICFDNSSGFGWIRDVNNSNKPIAYGYDPDTNEWKRDPELDGEENRKNYCGN